MRYDTALRANPYMDVTTHWNARAFLSAHTEHIDICTCAQAERNLAKRVCEQCAHVLDLIEEQTPVRKNSNAFSCVCVLGVLRMSC
jgi:hypothetical protein